MSQFIKVQSASGKTYQMPWLSAEDPSDEEIDAFVTAMEGGAKDPADPNNLPGPYKFLNQVGETALSAGKGMLDFVGNLSSPYGIEKLRKQAGDTLYSGMRGAYEAYKDPTLSAHPYQKAAEVTGKTLAAPLDAFGLPISATAQNIVDKNYGAAAVHGGLSLLGGLGLKSTFPKAPKTLPPLESLRQPSIPFTESLTARGPRQQPLGFQEALQTQGPATGLEVPPDPFAQPKLPFGNANPYKPAFTAERGVLPFDEVGGLPAPIPPPQALPGLGAPPARPALPPASSIQMPGQTPPRFQASPYGPIRETTSPEVMEVTPPHSYSTGRQISAPRDVVLPDSIPSYIEGEIIPPDAPLQDITSTNARIAADALARRKAKRQSSMLQKVKDFAADETGAIDFDAFRRKKAEETVAKQKPKKEESPVQSAEYQPLMAYKMPEEVRPIGDSQIGKLINKTEPTGNPSTDAQLTRMKEIVNSPRMSTDLWEELRTLGYEVSRDPNMPPGFRREWSQGSSEPTGPPLGPRSVGPDLRPLESIDDASYLDSTTWVPEEGPVGLSPRTVADIVSDVTKRPQEVYGPTEEPLTPRTIKNVTPQGLVPVKDITGREIAPPQTEPPTRPPGPWDKNAPNVPKAKTKATPEDVTALEEWSYYNKKYKADPESLSVDEMVKWGTIHNKIKDLDFSGTSYRPHGHEARLKELDIKKRVEAGEYVHPDLGGPEKLTYILPDGQRIALASDLTKGEKVIDFGLKDGTMVKARLAPPGTSSFGNPPTSPKTEGGLAKIRDFAKGEEGFLDIGEIGAGISQGLTKLKDYTVKSSKDFAKTAKTEFGKAPLETTGRFMRASGATGDLSFPFRQGWNMMDRPEFWKSFKPMIEGALSKEKYEKIRADMIKDPGWVDAKSAGIRFDDLGSIAERSEQFQTELVEKIPFLGEVAKFSSRGYMTFANKLRFESYKKLVKRAEKAYGGELPKELKAEIAEFVNNATGRGSLGKYESSATGLASAFFSPRLIASRVNMLNPKTYVNASPFVRKQYIRAMANNVALASTAIGVAYFAGADVEFDPRSSDFGKIKKGNTRIDITGGMAQYIRLMAQLQQGARKSSLTGKVTKLNTGKFGSPTKLTQVENFSYNKAAPLAGLVIDWLRGKDFKGDPFTWDKALINRVHPMIIQDAMEVMKEDPELIALMLPAFFGMGVQAYSENPIKRTRSPYSLPPIKMPPMR